MEHRIRDFWIGGYAAPGEAGVVRAALDARGGLSIVEENRELDRPSWLLRSEKRPLLYAAEELCPEGNLAALRLTEEGPRLAARVGTGGADPCHIAFAPGGRHLLVANYTGGSLAVVELDGEGLPRGLSDLKQHRAGGPTRGGPARQDGPHVHFSRAVGDRVWVADLGLNRIIGYRWDGERGRLGDVDEVIAFHDGAGPRHFDISPDGQFMAALCELDGTLHILRREGGLWRRKQVAFTREGGCGAGETAAAVRYDGPGALVASVRGWDRVVRFDVGPDGLLSGRRDFPAGGRTPRDVRPAGEWLLAANQDSDWIAVLDRDGNAAGGMRCVRPTCICEG